MTGNAIALFPGPRRAANRIARAERASRETRRTRERLDDTASDLAAMFAARMGADADRELRRAVQQLVRERGGTATLAAAEEFFAGCRARGLSPTVDGLAAWMEATLEH